MAGGNTTPNTDENGDVKTPPDQPDAVGVPGSQHDPNDPSKPTDSLPWTAPAPEKAAAETVADTQTHPEAAVITEPRPWNLHVSVEQYLEGLEQELTRADRKAKAAIKEEIDRIRSEHAVQSKKETA